MLATGHLRIAERARAEVVEIPEDGRKTGRRQLPCHVSPYGLYVIGEILFEGGLAHLVTAASDRCCGRWYHPWRAVSVPDLTPPRSAR
jgi:hypothetical protein